MAATEQRLAPITQFLKPEIKFDRPSKAPPKAGRKAAPKDPAAVPAAVPAAKLPAAAEFAQGLRHEALD